MTKQQRSKSSNVSKGALSLTSYSFSDYIPLLIVFAFILLSAAIFSYKTGFTGFHFMSSTMGFFFIFFAFFKFLNLPGFVEGYKKYDLIAQRVSIWAWLYPFIELGLGVSYLLYVQSAWLYIFTIVITLINTIGVARKIAQKEAVMCACLGTILKVPLTTVTLVEYGVMGVMALAMLLM